MFLGVSLILVSLSMILLVCLIVQRSVLIALEKEKVIFFEAARRERQAVSDIICIASEIVDRELDRQEFFEGYLEYILRFFNASGGAILENDGNGFFTGSAVSGIFPLLKEVPEEIEYELILNPVKHKESLKGWTSKFDTSDIDDLCGEKNFAFFFNQSPIWFPERFLKQASGILIAPVRVDDRMEACVILVFSDTPDDPEAYEREGEILTRLNLSASAVIEFFRIFGERQAHEAYILANREENIMQLSSGIMHNIGNAMTIAKLASMDLCERFSFNEKERPETLILDEMIPVLQEKIRTSTVQEFLSNDPVGKDYLNIISELLRKMRLSSEFASGELAKLSERLSHIGEIVELQQYFSGEFGSSGPANLSRTISSAVSIFDGAFNRTSIRVRKNLDEHLPELPVAPVMLIQVLINIMKNAAEAIESERNPAKDFFIDVRLYYGKNDAGQDCAIIEVEDNGPGMGHEIKDHIFEFGFSTKSKNGTRGRGLHSCASILKKYDGSMTVDSTPGHGATFKIFLPIADPA